MKYVYVVLQRTVAPFSPFVPSSVHSTKEGAEAQKTYLMDEGVASWRISILRTEFYG